MRRVLVLAAGAAITWLLAAALTGGLHGGVQTLSGRSYGFFDAQLSIAGVIVFAFMFGAFWFATRPKRERCPRCGQAVRRRERRCPKCRGVLTSV
jgi:hypothetical protein